MDNIMISFMQDAVNGHYGHIDLSHTDVCEFMDRASQADKNVVIQYQREWNELENEEINTADLSTHVKKTIEESLVV